jgi:glycosyltransferase involved in cell wall biosynthesis
MSSRRVLILQGQLAEYRRPVFNRLADDFAVTVAHSGRAMARADDRFRELILPKRAIGPFHVHARGLIPGLMRDADATIAMFDLGWPAYVLPAFDQQRHGRFILWGHRYGSRPLANRVRERAMRRADALLMYGHEHDARMIAAGIDPARIFHAPNTMDVPNQADFSGADKRSILFVGRLQPRKRLDLALESFAAIIDRIPADIAFDIVGAGEPEAALKAQAIALGIADRVHFHGAITDDERLAQLFAAAFAYVSPGPVGLSVLHSFAYGVPVLTLRDGYHGPEFHNLISGENGLIVDTDEVFAPALLRLITEPGLATRLGAAAFQRYAGERTIGHMIAGFKMAIEGAGDSGHGQRN